MFKVNFTSWIESLSQSSNRQNNNKLYLYISMSTCRQMESKFYEIISRRTNSLEFTAWASARSSCWLRTI